MTIPSTLPFIVLASALLLACDGPPRTSSGLSHALDTASPDCAAGKERCVDAILENDGSTNHTGTLSNPAQAASETASIGFCGDGIRNGIESCDDGNLDDTDRCSNSCSLNDSPTASWYVRDDPIAGLSYCGDGLVNQRTEECDDGNGDDTDHCTNRCLIQDPVDPSESTVSTNQQSQQEDNSCVELHTRLGLPIELCD